MLKFHKVSFSRFGDMDPIFFKTGSFLSLKEVSFMILAILVLSYVPFNMAANGQK